MYITNIVSGLAVRTAQDRHDRPEVRPRSSGRTVEHIRRDILSYAKLLCEVKDPREGGEGIQ